MLFHSYGFIFLFLPLTLLGFFSLGRLGLFHWARAWLVLASLVFYSWWDIDYLPLLLTSIMVNYQLGRMLASRPGRGLLAMGVAFNLTLLAYFKYAIFIVGNINQLAGSDYHIQEIVLPLAISFCNYSAKN